MTRSLAIIGGTYKELTRFPNSSEMYGSGGRAAAVSAGFGINTTLHTVIGSGDASYLETLSKTFGFGLDMAQSSETCAFEYTHPLSTPTIIPLLESITKIHLNVTADVALVFGMIDATAQVKAKRVVYDPQNPRDAQPFSPAPGSSPKIAYVLNLTEATRLSGESDPVRAAKVIAKKYSASVVVVKQGPWGALVYEKGATSHIPCYKTKRVWPIGSGDVFAAAFAVFWGSENQSAKRAAIAASRAAALYVNSRVLPISRQDVNAKQFQFAELHLSKRRLAPHQYHVYLAGPFFNMSQQWLLEETRAALMSFGLKVFSPLHDVGRGNAHEVVPLDIGALKASRAVFALVDGVDCGTIFEVGYARALGKPAVVFAECTPVETMKMMEGTQCELSSDLSTSIYYAHWQAH